MIDDLPLRWVVTGLFVLSAVGFVLVIDRRSIISIVSHLLHLTMALAMAAMAWPQGLRIPTTPGEVFFLAAALWFAVIAALPASTAATRLMAGYHVLKMLAMAWMYAVMGGHLTPKASAHHGPMPGMDMPEMPGMSGLDNVEGPARGALPNWINICNWLWAAFFVLAAFAWGYRYITLGRGGPLWRSRLGTVVQAMTAGGMAIMFAVMLVLPPKP